MGRVAQVLAREGIRSYAVGNLEAGQLIRLVEGETIGVKDATPFYFSEHVRVPQSIRRACEEHH
jgi:hypothetical protein